MRLQKLSPAPCGTGGAYNHSVELGSNDTQIVGETSQNLKVNPASEAMARARSLFRLAGEIDGAEGRRMVREQAFVALRLAHVMGGARV